jgi:hypothetical protein
LQRTRYQQTGQQKFMVKKCFMASRRITGLVATIPRHVLAAPIDIDSMPLELSGKHKISAPQRRNFELCPQRASGRRGRRANSPPRRSVEQSEMREARNGAP